ncbi:MAG TPA: hypothetical protein VM165_12380 [Planctomycetaceae bacterium]|nr:hypothetical protein [Planctomycetaceae bacterium]
MPPLLADPPPPTLPPRTNAPSADRLRTTMAATKVSFTWFGVRKSLSAAQKALAADSFSAEAKFLSAAKKLLDTQHPAYQAVTAVRGQIVQHWKSLTLPYPEPGLRLIRQEDLAPFDQQLGRFRDDLRDAVQALDEQYAELRRSARGRLGDLFNDADYPPSLRAEFAVIWEFPRVWSHRRTSRSSIPASTSRSASGSRPGSMKRSSWPSRRSSTNWANWSAI